MRVGVLLVVCLIAAAVAAPALAPYPPDRLDLGARREAPSAAHWFGTDDLGRDILSRVLYGARVSLAVGVLSAAVAGASGIMVGGVAGYAGGALDAILMRGTDAMLAVPRLPHSDDGAVGESGRRSSRQPANVNGNRAKVYIVLFVPFVISCISWQLT
jgi:ABC-type dipeptide/oligopeptide/nickel transport system permease subunit